MICDKCGKETCVIFIKLNPGRICGKCEEIHRKEKGHKNKWEDICKRMKERYPKGGYNA